MNTILESLGFRPDSSRPDNTEYRLTIGDYILYVNLTANDSVLLNLTETIHGLNENHTETLPKSTIKDVMAMLGKSLDQFRSKNDRFKDFSCIREYLNGQSNLIPNLLDGISSSDTNNLNVRVYPDEVQPHDLIFIRKDRMIEVFLSSSDNLSLPPIQPFAFNVDNDKLKLCDAIRNSIRDIITYLSNSENIAERIKEFIRGLERVIKLCDLYISEH